MDIELKDLRKKLPKWYATDMADKFGMTYHQIYRIAKGLTKSRVDVYLALLKMAVEEQQRLKEIAELQKQLETV